MEIQIFGVRNADLVSFRKRISNLATDLGARSVWLREINQDRAIVRKLGTGPRGLAVNGRIVWSGDEWPSDDTLTPILVDALRVEEHERIDEPAATD